MFYSHEMLSSPEHGVATIWLVATLGSRSLTRRLNRKAIQDVDVPEACNVIINPEAPMALRLQGSLLYGVSKVYDQQCGYTLLDAQTMRDKMVSMLKQLPGGGLDPSAGKTKPTNLILPYDLSFIPETGLPGLDIDFAFTEAAAVQTSSQRSDSWASSPGNYVSGHSQLGLIDLDLYADEFIGAEGLQSLHVGDVPSGEKRGLFGRRSRPDREDEGVLLQPDFEFDEDGNLIELDESNDSPRKRRKGNFQGEPMGALTGELIQDDVMMMNMNKDGPLPARDDDQQPQTLPSHKNGEDPRGPSVERRLMEDGELDRTTEARAHQRIRRVKMIGFDDNTALRNTDLARWNDEYAANMAQALKQKNHNKLPTLAKKNAQYWVFGLGIGSIGRGLGQHREKGPLSQFSGDALYMLLTPEKSSARAGERNRPERRSVHQGHGQKERTGSLDVEIARNAPSSAYNDRSSEMPWNLTASLPGSIRGQRFSSISGSSARHRGRLTSASPLSGRSYADRRERNSSLSILNAGDVIDNLEELEITRYLEGELAPDREDISAISARRKSVFARVVSALDTESLNFLDFIQTKVEETNSDSSGGVTFSELLPPSSTTRTVAAQGFLNVLTLATKGAIGVAQKSCDNYGVFPRGDRFQYGEIFLQLAGTA
ncbi:hypothetical protein N7539_004821 [Penicillium diatomitis]|uniref:Rad21/Rec8-like protein N-terminal domain-containing protein n=1 Tax=Penicillium diatomitis TaxID=2819901 RepID=A0A9W9X5J2_9EURO|nr:uncharacterized protein N7539_004821 [Penicillium diatomitis]KAJ5484833.1 hypothetical protein N7539_004821 [Penicillium diatomitis]